MENQVWICNVGQVILRQRQRKRKPRIRGWITQELHWRAHRSSDPDVHKNVWNWVLRYIYLKKKKYNGFVKLRWRANGGSLLEVSHNVTGDEYRLLIQLAVIERWFPFVLFIFCCYSASVACLYHSHQSATRTRGLNTLLIFHSH